MQNDVTPLAALQGQRDFSRRHIGPRDAHFPAMLERIGAESLEGLIDEAVPGGIRMPLAKELPDPLTERQAVAKLNGYAKRNKVLTSLIGMGYHDCDLPAVIQRNVLENPGWYTAYTPYQAEISQGRLEGLLNFQTMIADLTGMDLANASLLDEATAAAEAMTLLHRLSKAKTNRFFVDQGVHPQTLAVLRTRAEPLEIELQVGDPDSDLALAEVFGALLQNPTSDGAVRDLTGVIAGLHERGALAAVAADPLSLVLVKSPGEMGADVVIGSAQRFGVPLGFGGPHAAYMATKDAHKRSLPGRIVGVSVDRAGRTALRLALQTREQHIRREKATSNICTAQVLLAVLAGFYGVYHGPEGLRRIARRVHRQSCVLAAGLKSLGAELQEEVFFDTLTLKAAEGNGAFVARALEAGINLRRYDDGRVGIALDEATEVHHLEKLFNAYAGKEAGVTVADIEAQVPDALPTALLRQDEILEHPSFHAYRSETEMLRYLRRLQEKDIALDRSMIPLGSCTMKLNATTEMLPITWPEFSRIHPFAPLDQAEGYLALIRETEDWLAKLTGFSAVSLQPNAGSQGEYAGLLAIRGYHRSRGEEQRKVCLIPSSAHGTNPASAIMAGMSVVVVGCDELGNIDIEDLKAKAEKHAEELAALMVTYPSTHGVFEEAINEICDLVHQHGGQVYMDGANLNALLGIAKPGRIGADVMHMNLHKTFCIPHGGGGPGIGPIGLAEHLAPFAPNHPLAAEAGPETGPGPVSAAPWGSASILPISWAYIAMMGREGLIKATQVAILNANYMATRLGEHFKVLYTGQNGRVAHECILDVRPLKDEAHISNEDIAKRLIDYGFHAPTMSWPVPGTLMIEPTESESRAELDRFCDAMISILEEARRVQKGDWPEDDNPLVNAPHTAEELIGDDWSHPYSRSEAAYPVDLLRQDKYWPPVARIDNVYGDRNLVCSCPPLEDYQEAAE
ncbi:MAG: aminomethyl-transferring glycine dehydrogenase [Limibacillus sp.]|jgi:glycine dehydrogenase